MEKKSSVLKAIIEEVYVASSFEAAITIVKEHIEDSPIRGSEGRMIIHRAMECGPSLERLQQYLTNSWFKYEGMGV
jgi:hypothetical protein